VTSVPISHIDEAHKLIADGEVDLFDIYPLSGGTVYVKNDNDVLWQGNNYEGLPVLIDGEKWSADTSTPTPRMTIGQDNLDLLPFKGLINDGYLDGAKVVRYRVLLNNIINNINIKEITSYRVKRIESYSRTKIVMILTTFSGAANQTIPFRQYIPPAFPWVEIR
jgi:phage-related protein